MKKQLSYTHPVLRHGGYNMKAKWFVAFEVTNLETNEVSRQQHRGNINKFKTKSLRLEAAEMVMQEWRDRIKAGYNPFEKAADAAAPDAPAAPEAPAEMTFEKAIAFGLSKCRVSPKTMQCYRSSVRMVSQAATLAGYHTTPISQIKKSLLMKVFETGLVDLKWTNKTYNKHVNYLKAVISRLEHWEIIDNNPALKIKALPVDETEKYKPYTDAEKKAIQEHLFVNFYRYFVILMILHDTGIRPKEVLGLKVQSINLDERLISIYPDMALGNSKTHKVRKVPIADVLLPFLRELKLHEHDPKCFVFGSPYERGKGNRGSAKGGLTGVRHPEYFKPSFTPIKVDTITRLWHDEIMVKLGINKHQYAAKHTGANAKILAGIDLDTLKGLYGHSSILMTEKYAKEIQTVRKKAIIALSPAFTASAG